MNLPIYLPGKRFSFRFFGAAGVAEKPIVVFFGGIHRVPAVVIQVGVEDQLAMTAPHIDGLCHLQAVDGIHHRVAKSVKGTYGNLRQTGGKPADPAAAHRHNGGKPFRVNASQLPGAVAAHAVPCKVHPLHVHVGKLPQAIDPGDDSLHHLVPIVHLAKGCRQQKAPVLMQPQVGEAGVPLQNL